MSRVPSLIFTRQRQEPHQAIPLALPPLYRFCSKLYSRTKRDQFALAVTTRGDASRHLVRIRLFLSAKLYAGPGRPALSLRLALVDTFAPISDKRFPWGPRSIDTGIRIYSRDVRDTRFITLDDLHASTIVSAVETVQYGPCFASISCDKEGEEPEFWLATDDADNDAAMQAQLDMQDDVMQDDIDEPE